MHGQPAYGTGSKVVLTTAHLDHTPEHCDDDNLRAMCQGCHLHYDRDEHGQPICNCLLPVEAMGYNHQLACPVRWTS